MKNKNFENIIKHKLAGMTSNTSSSDWEEFEHLLDDDQAMDQLLDDKVASEMLNMRSSYKPEHWIRLTSNLALQKERINNIIGYKMIELSMILLLLLSANTYFEHLDIKNNYNSAQAYAALTSTKLNNAERVVAPNTLSDNPSSIDIETLSSGTSITSLQNGENKSLKIIQNDKTNLHNIVYQPSHNYSTDQYVQIEPESLNSIENTTNEAQNTRIEGISDLVNTAVDALSYERDTPDNSLDYILPAIIIPTHSTDSKKWMTAYIGLDNNLINSPFDIVYREKGYDTYGLGYTIGTEVSIQNNKAEFGIGLAYSSRSYDPRYIGETYGSTTSNYFETGLEHIDFDILTLPVSFRYAFIQQPKWAIDISVGASANVIAWSDYDIKNVSLDQNVHTLSIPNSRDLLIDDKPLHKGLLHGGTLRENLYYTVDMSLGLTSQLTESNFLSIRPGYSIHTMSEGIGPNNDHIHKLSLNIGIKHLL